MDAIDQKIILQLQKSGRQNYVKLARELGVSERTVRNRVKELLDDGIMSITAVPNLDMLGYTFMSIVALQIRLADLRSVTSQLIQHKNVCYLANVTGRYDLIAIIVTKSSREFADFMENVVSEIPSIIRTETFVSLNIYKGQQIGIDTQQLISNLDLNSYKKKAVT